MAGREHSTYRRAMMALRMTAGLVFSRKQRNRLRMPEGCPKDRSRKMEERPISSRPCRMAVR